MSAPQLPAFASVLKSRDVEDPVNLWVHRPLAYGFVALIYRSPITPNQVTLLAMLVGIVAGGCILVGTPQALLWGGALLWVSAILDGADGILARARKQISELGRALDGSADLVVAVATVAPALLHIWRQQHDPALLVLAPIAVVSALLHIYLYDFFKDSYLMMTNPQWNGEPERVADVEARLARVRARNGNFAERMACQLHLDLVRAQTWLIARTNPWASRNSLTFRVTPETVAIYRQHNRRLVKLWALISLSPHSYLMAIAAMTDRLELYLWARLVLANALFVVAMLWQRRASRLSREQLERAGLAPVDALAA